MEQDVMNFTLDVDGVTGVCPSGEKWANDNCIGRVLNNLVDENKIVHIDALRLHKKYSDVFLMDDVPEEERKETAHQVAESIIASLRGQQLS